MRQYYAMIKNLLIITVPLIISNLVNAASSLINMYFISKIGRDALAAGALITSSYGLLVMMVVSILYAVGIKVGRYHGSKAYAEVGKILFSGLGIVFMIGLPLTIVMCNIKSLLIWAGQPPIICKFVGEYFEGIAFGFIPSLIIVVYSQFLIGIGLAQIIFYLTILGVLLNSFLNYSFIFGNFDVPQLGLFGAGVASSVTNYFLLLTIILSLSSQQRFKTYQLFNKASFKLTYFKEIMNMGFPISLQYTSELLAFSCLTYLVGFFGIEALGAQQISLQTSMFAIMIVMGFSQGSSILMSQSVGKADFSAPKKIGTCSFLLCGLTMMIIAFFYWRCPDKIITFYLNEKGDDATSIIKLATSFLAITGLTQIFDGGRNIAAGLLRGYGDTKSSMWTGIVSCWILGIPCAFLLAFICNLGAIGIRLGMMIGILIGCMILIFRFYRYDVV